MIHRFKTIDSTNTYAKELACQGAPHGTVVVAKQQTGGRGRMGRSFFSPPGTGLYLSMILRPHCSAQDLMHLTCVTAVASCDAIAQVTGFRPNIKWTNDLVCNGKKIGGILTELGFNGFAPGYAIIGIGINCNQSTHDFPPELQQMATSLSAVTSKSVDIKQLEKALIDTLLKSADNMHAKQNQFMDQYRADCITIGQDISLVTSDSIRHARAIAVENDGSLRIKLADGSEELVSSGEVSIRGMYGYL